LQFVQEQTLQMLEAIKEVSHDMLGSCLWRDRSSHTVDFLEVLHCQSWWRSLVEFSNLVQNFNSFGFFAATDQKLGRLVEGENEISKEEDQ
jgi:hypothetical protein